MMRYWDSHWNTWGMGAGGWLLMLIFWAAVVGVVVWLIAGNARRRGSPAEASALEVLKQRYARGEIDQQEFERRKRDLTE